MNSSISYSNLRENLKSTLDHVCLTHNPMLVKRKNGEDVVIVSRADFESLEETNYLLSSAKNAARLYKALKSKKKDRIQFSTTADLKNEVRNRAKRS